MKFKCIKPDTHGAYFTKDQVYVLETKPEDPHVIDDEGDLHEIIVTDNFIESGMGRAQFKLVQDEDQIVSTHVLSELQQKCKQLNMSISIDPEGFNIFDIDTEKQVLVHSVGEVDEIVSAKESYQESMSKWEWL